MTRFFGAGGASAIAATCILALGSTSPAAAQVATSAASNVSLATTSPSPATAAPAVTVNLTQPSARAAILSSTPRPDSGVTAAPTGAIAVRPAVTHAGLWPLVYANMTGTALDEEMNCVATAVYFEARGEPFDGQLAVAEVVMNRASSGRYPTSLCAVVKQPWQFSFVRNGRFPRHDPQSASWSYAQAIARIAQQRLADALPDDVLWYHADYVAPGWGRRLSKVEKIGAHIFYRA
jgi:spore germination cell wall hydrolase CwlJ-like protein